MKIVGSHMRMMTWNPQNPTTQHKFLLKCYCYNSLKLVNIVKIYYEKSRNHEEKKQTRTNKNKHITNSITYSYEQINPYTNQVI